ncbi:MAG: AAA family ATPase [Lachnospiraceae bacterium]|nr:AAA family ATPase [Lachnospiraceae bacterium]
MELTVKQDQALKLAVARYKANEPYTCIAGYAGTGKSTLVQFIIAALDIDPERVAYISYTGKSARVLKNKGCPQAMTAHRFLYKSYMQKDGTFVNQPKYGLRAEYDLVVLDEASMLPEKMWELLLSHRIHVLALGDPGQLKPVMGTSTILDQPHIFLDEIMRQAKESEIIRLSMDIRDGKLIKPYRGNEVNIVNKKDFCDGMLLWADQVLCGKNATRMNLNDHYRKLIWKDGQDLSAPLVGDRVICLANDWDVITPEGDALVNGTIGKITRIGSKYVEKFGRFPAIDLQPDDTDEFKDLLIDWKLITEHEPTITKDNFKKYRKLRLEQFDYGYVVTGHKSQGSEWSKVLVLEERLKGSKDDHIKWLYTCCTRPEEKLTLVLDD